MPWDPSSVPMLLKKGNRGNGTITDIDGNFSLKVKPGATLEIHYIGYKTVEVKAVPGKPLNVTLTEDSEMLDEVVVVGYGTMRRKRCHRLRRTDTPHSHAERSPPRPCKTCFAVHRG